MTNITRVGFIGLGEMGKPMAKNLFKHHCAIATCTHIRKQAAEELKELGAEVFRSPQEVATASEVVITMVRDIPQTDEVIYGRGVWEGKGVLQGIKAGTSVIVCSTLLPGYCRRLAEAGKQLQIEVLDAPVSGGYLMAESGGLTFMIGGNRDTFLKYRHLFKAMGKNIFYLGGPGTGQAMKLINNYMMIVNSFGTSEAIAAGLKAGLKLRQMLEIIGKSSGNSAVIRDWQRLTASHQDSRKRKRDKKSIFGKDLELAISFFEELGCEPDLGRQTLKIDESRLFPPDDENST